MVGKLLCCNSRFQSNENNVWALCKRNADLRHFLPTSVLLYIYNSFIHLYLSFALWSGAKLQNTNLDKILLLQKRALRLIYFSNNSGHAIPLFLRSNILPIDMLYYKSGVLMHDIDHDLPPQNLKNLFTRLNLLRNRLSGCHTTLLLPFGGVLRDIPKDGCEGDHTRLALIHSYKTRAPVAVNFMLFIHK